MTKEIKQTKDIQTVIDELAIKGVEALNEMADFTQEQVDHIVHHAAIAALDKHMYLAKLAVDETGRGIYEDKAIKNMYASEYIWNSIKNDKTVGVIAEDKEQGLVSIAEPVGVICGVTPTTNPTSTTIFKALIALKTRNSIVFAFHPSAQKSSAEAARIVRDAAIEAGVKRVVCLSTDKAAYPINAMGISKAMMEHVIFANARVAAKRGGTVICCTRYGNVMCSRGSVIPLFIDQIKNKKPITVTDPNMTRFLMNLDEAVDLVRFAFEHANPGDLFIQKADASTIGDLAKAVQKLFGDTGINVIGTRHGEKLYETLMTREERLRSEDMGGYYRVAADSRDLNYDKFVVHGEVHTMADEFYTSHNTNRLDVEGTINKILTTDYVKEELKGIRHN